MFLPGESQGRGSLVGCRLWGRTELDMTEATQQQQQQQQQQHWHEVKGKGRKSMPVLFLPTSLIWASVASQEPE